jgi:NitT/TauT family transport system substrate-binding protein
MKTKSIHIMLSLSLALLLILSANGRATSAQGGDMTKLTLGYSVWVGYGPLFIARDKGYFKDAGLDVTLVKVADPKERFTALAGGKLDGLVSTLDTMAQYWKTETPFHAILGLDESSGGDGIVANAGIETVKDLKGKKIGVNIGSVSQFFMEFVLEQNGMSGDDVTLVKMGQDDVPAALASGRIDAGVTWEPNLSQSVRNGAKLIANSKETPGLIVDILILRDDVLKANPKAGPALVSAWNKAIDYWKANEDDADAIMAKGLGSFYVDGDQPKMDVIKGDLKGATLFDAEHNAKFFNGTDKGTATATLKFAIDFYTKLGIITTPVKAEDMIDSSYIVMPSAATATATVAK